LGIYCGLENSLPGVIYEEYFTYLVVYLGSEKNVIEKN
jgi:hypothetical protein